MVEEWVSYTTKLLSFQDSEEMPHAHAEKDEYLS